MGTNGYQFREAKVNAGLALCLFKLKMDTISTLIKVSLPRYLKNLPIPDSLSGFASLTGTIAATSAVNLLISCNIALTNALNKGA